MGGMISTPHGELETSFSPCASSAQGQISTPHGELETGYEKGRMEGYDSISTPHGELETDFLKIWFILMFRIFQLHTVN